MRFNNISKQLRYLFNLAIILACSATLAEVTDADLSGLKLASETKTVKIYIAADADLSQYNAIQVNPITVNFDEKWLKTYNQSQSSISNRLRENDLKRISGRYSKGYLKIITRTISKKDGLSIANEAGKNTLKLSSEINNLRLYAPDKHGATPTTSFVYQAGKATLHSKLFDSNTGKLLAAIVDKKETRDHVDLIRANRAINQSEFHHVYVVWAKNVLIALGQKN